MYCVSLLLCKRLDGVIVCRAASVYGFHAWSMELFGSPFRANAAQVAIMHAVRGHLDSYGTHSITVHLIREIQLLQSAFLAKRIYILNELLRYHALYLHACVGISV